MAARYVAIDTESTGLDPQQDELIEVAAIAFDLAGESEQFQTLIKPQRQLPYQIERLTGIRGLDLETAPSVSDVAGDIAAFIAEATVVGQNINFDLTLLARAGILSSGPAVDTWDLAQLLLPGLASYSLRSLAEHFAIDFPVRHRAMADAEATMRVFLALRHRLAALPLAVLRDVDLLVKGGQWSTAPVIDDVLTDASSLQASSSLTDAGLATPETLAPPLAEGRGGVVSASDCLTYLRSAETLQKHFPQFERRPEQERMTQAVAGALADGQHLIVEAGTGTGKSLAYLLPAAAYALRTGSRVLVSTDTIGLQEQLVDKDLPSVRALLQGEEEELRFASLKGRGNYLCLQRWLALQTAAPDSPEEARLRARVRVWLLATQTGDRAELGVQGGGPSWSRLSAENSDCRQTACPFVRDGTCFLLRARRRAESAHVLVVNHALLLSDLAADGRVLPPYEHLIIDEAHNLEQEATKHFSFRASEADFADFIDRIGRSRKERSAIGRSLADSFRADGAPSASLSYLSSLGDALVSLSGKLHGHLREPFAHLHQVIEDYQEDRGHDVRLLLTRGVRAQHAWSEVEIACDKLISALDPLLDALESLRRALEASSEGGLPNQDALMADVVDLAQLGAHLREGLNSSVLADDSSLICWLDRSRNTGEISINSAPLDVSDILRDRLFATKASVTLTSATLSTEDRFDFLRERVGLEDSDELMLGSPFNFPESTLMVLPSDLPEPDANHFAATTGHLLIEACRASEGRALILCTSYGALNAIYGEIKALLEAEGILVLAHGLDGTPRQMLTALRENSRTVVLGTASFWEGVDLAGEALSLLAIVRLPFAVPSDPIYQARSALYDDPFEEYALPQAILRFRQGFGRLIRRKTDRGVLLVLDRRLSSRRYGEAFLNSLPRCTVRELASREVAAAVRQWVS